MRAKRAMLILWLVFLSCLAAAGAETGRVLVLDIGRWPHGRPGSAQHRVILLDIETGKALASTDLGGSTNVALSPSRNMVAAVSHVQGVGTRLDFFRAFDLTPINSGRFLDLIPRGMYKIGASVDSVVSPDGQELLIGGLDPEGHGNVDLQTTVLTRVRCQLDENGIFERVGETVKIPLCRSVRFVSAADWPRVQVLNTTRTTLETVDLDSGKILSRLPLGDKPGLDQLDPDKLPKDDVVRLIQAGRNQGVVVPAGGRFAYYVPRPVIHSPVTGRATREPGRLKKIELTANPPKLETTDDQPQGYLRVEVVCASEVAGSLFVLEHARNADGTYAPSRRLVVIRTSDLKFERFIELPLTACEAIEASSDGRSLYALDPEEAKLAVIDLARPAAVIRVINLPAKYPRFIVAPQREP